MWICMEIDWMEWKINHIRYVFDVDRCCLMVYFLFQPTLVQLLSSFCFAKKMPPVVHALLSYSDARHLSHSRQFAPPHKDTRLTKSIRTAFSSMILTLAMTIGLVHTWIIPPVYVECKIKCYRRRSNICNKITCKTYETTIKNRIPNLYIRIFRCIKQWTFSG